jgi:6-phosphogluconolactonase
MSTPTAIKNLAATLALGAAASGAIAATYVYVANADSHEISVLQMDRASGELQAVQTLDVGGVVMPMAVRSDNRMLYAAIRSQPFRVLSLEIDASSGRLTNVGEAALADSMANIDLDRSGRWLFAASYGGNKITVNSVGEDGHVGAVQQLIVTKPNAHAIHVDAANRYVFATSLGADNLSSWRFDSAKGTLTANEPALIETGHQSGPRHFVWDQAQRRAYLLCELDGSLYVFDYDTSLGTLRETQRISSLPPGFVGKPWAADLHLTPDGRHLYASERTSSTIAIYGVDPATGRIRLLDHVATEKTPRGFAIDPSGRYLVASGQDSNAITIYAIDAANGALSRVQRVAVGKNPNWVEIIDISAH